MEIKRAVKEDAKRINELLHQVQNVHASGRPDIFVYGAKKYGDEELNRLICDDERPVYVAKKAGEIYGYIFCIYETTKGCNNLKDMKTLYIDDLCVDEKYRGMGIGRKLYEYAHNMAKNTGCYRVTLNVWNLNEGAVKFYEKCGLKPLKITMEDIV